jgi:uncharacterized protein (DUF433 family)
MSDDLTITHEPRRCAGHPTVGPTRICVHSIIGRLKLYDWDKAAMLEAEQPGYGEAHVDAAVAYYREHLSEIEGILEEQRQDFEEGLKRQQEKETRCAFLLTHLQTEPGFQIVCRGREAPAGALWEATCYAWDYWAQGRTKLECLERAWGDWREMREEGATDA